MSSLVRNIQRSFKSGYQYMGRGSKLGVSNPKDKSLLARLDREEKRRREKRA